ncbi:MAG TPA: hypothetical protein VGJ16_06865, partial [Pirellulales bacterium]
MPDPFEEPRARWWELPWDRIGFVLGPAAAALWFASGAGSSLTIEGERLCGVLLLTIVWWLTEPIPIPVTGLLAVALAVVVGAVPAGEKAPPAVALEAFGN